MTRSDKDVWNNPIVEEMKLPRKLKSQKKVILRQIRNVIGNELVTERK